MKRYLQLAAAFLLLAFVVIQFIPVHRTNRLGAGDPQAPRKVQWILRRACYDCHSTETRWPVWAYVAPMSWQVVADVDRARKFLNFSDWASLPPLYQQAMRMNIERVNATHKMPLWYYVTLHPDAKLSDADRKILAQWARFGRHSGRTVFMSCSRILVRGRSVRSNQYPIWGSIWSIGVIEGQMMMVEPVRL